MERPFDHRCTGSFTTLSIFSSDTALFSEGGAWQTALGYVVLSIASCVLDAGLKVVGLIKSLGHPCGHFRTPARSLFAVNSRPSERDPKHARH